MMKNRTRFLTTGIALIMLSAAALLFLPRLSTAAGAEVWTGNIAGDFGGGSGTEKEPYLIAEGSQLAFLAQQVNGGTDYAGVYFALADDIDLGCVEWTPISYSGYDNNGNPLRKTDFAGTLDGQGHTISRLTISDGGASRHAGLFGYSSGTIKSLYLDDVKIESINGIGAICAYNSGTIEACGVNGGELKITGANGGNVGGICESNSGTVSRCYNMADIVDGTENGGVCSTNSAVGTIENCYNGGSIAAAGGFSNSGICSGNNGTIKSCLNFGKFGGGTAKASSYYGICGNGIGTIENCYNDSRVSDVDAYGYRGTKTNVANKDTMELCRRSLPNGFDGSVWTVGSQKSEYENGSASFDFCKMICTYPSLSGVGTAHKSGEIYLYGFGSTTGLQEYTLIRNADEFVAIGKDSTAWDKNYVLATDIDLAGRTDVMPIGNETTAFTGNFSGDRHTISNIEINSPDDNYVGLFGNSSGLITRISVENASISGGEKTGGICGSNN